VRCGSSPARARNYNTYLERDRGNRKLPSANVPDTNSPFLPARRMVAVATDAPVQHASPRVSGQFLRVERGRQKKHEEKNAKATMHEWQLY
jgi:hypothetical protein